VTCAQARWICLVLGLTLAFSWGPPARAASDGDDQRTAAARKLYELGMGRFQLDEWDAAIAYWEEGFRNRPAPEFLYNIGQAHRLAHRPDKALVFYQKYLRMSPDAANRAEVERVMATLERSAPPANAGAQPTASSAGPAAPSDRPLVRKPWFWVAVGGGIAVVATAVTVGVVVGTQKHDDAKTLDPIQFGLRF
jgi:tetratricopeptide (TPR) repeat protein